MSRYRRKRTFKRLYAALAALAALLFYGYQEYLAPAPSMPHGTLSVHFIDVGQGDSILLTCGGQSALVDAGTAEGGDAVVEYLRSQHLQQLDYVFATHPHADHIGGMSKVLDTFGCQTFIMPDAAAYTRTFENMLQSVEACGAQAQTGQAGDSFSLGQAQLQLLWPTEGYQDDNANNVSLVIRVEYGAYSFLLTGDAESSVEEQFTGSLGPVTVLKAGHHGSDTSSCAQLLDAAGPQYCVISVGAGNSYGHPSSSVLAELEARGCTVLRTDQQGNIVFTIKDGALAYATER